jgi:hypothetical protein
MLRLVAEPPDVPDSSRVQVDLSGPGAKHLISESRPVSDWFFENSVVLKSRQGFPPGPYHLTISGWRAGYKETSQYAFTIRVQPSERRSKQQDSGTLTR